MASPKKPATKPVGPLSPQRSARLYRLLRLLRGGPKSREELARAVSLDLRGFYRDLKKLRDLGVKLASEGHRYQLAQTFDRAISRLPFPDPRLNLHEALQLADGDSAAHRKLRARIRTIVGRS